LIVVLALLAAACASSKQAAVLLHPGAVEQTVEWQGQARTYLLHLPGGKPGTRLVPLVVVLHGASVTAAQTERYYHWDDLADATGFGVAYPQGLDNAWNAGSCCGDAPSRGTDDLGFIGAVIADAASRVPTDPTRIYLTGVSNGAMMTVRYACERPGHLAAIGSVAGTFTSPCDRPPPIPFIAIHGLQDELVSYERSSSTAESGSDLRLPAVETIARFLAANGCPAPVTVTAGPVHTETATCPAGRDVKVITIDGAGHQWPGATIDRARLERDGPSNQPSRAIDATTELWSFFSAHVLRR
jgi:polyhydroxybutyrate depolymerase